MRGETMTGQEIINHVVCGEMPDMDSVREKCIQQTTIHKKHIKRSPPRSMALAATAAVLVLCFFLFWNSARQASNSFSIKAYALEYSENGSIVMHEGHTAEATIMSGSMTGEEEGSTFCDLYFSFCFDVKGENINGVEFFTDGEGDFKKVQYLTKNGEFVDSEHGLTVISEKYLGNSFTLDDLGSLTDGYVLLAGKHGPVYESFTLTVRAVATFNDGATQEEIFDIFIPMPPMPTY